MPDFGCLPHAKFWGDKVQRHALTSGRNSHINRWAKTQYGWCCNQHRQSPMGLDTEGGAPSQALTTGKLNKGGDCSVACMVTRSLQEKVKDRQGHSRHTHRHANGESEGTCPRDTKGVSVQVPRGWGGDSDMGRDGIQGAAGDHTWGWMAAFPLSESWSQQA